MINLNATGRADNILRSIPNKVIVTGNACIELEAGANYGHADAEQLKELLAAGVVERVEIGSGSSATYEFLIDGSARSTLDDGEAATIACAIEQSGIALIAKFVCRKRVLL